MSSRQCQYFWPVGHTLSSNGLKIKIIIVSYSKKSGDGTFPSCCNTFRCHEELNSLSSFLPSSVGATHSLLANVTFSHTCFYCCQRQTFRFFCPKQTFQWPGLLYAYTLASREGGFSRLCGKNLCQQSSGSGEGSQLGSHQWYLCTPPPASVTKGVMPHHAELYSQENQSKVKHIGDF